MADSVKPVYLHLSFLASQTRESVDYTEKSFVSFKIDNEQEFKSWLGQVTCNLYDIYKLAQTMPDEREITTEMARLLSNPLYLELKSWAGNQVAYLNKEGKPWQTLVLKLGAHYDEFVDFLETNAIQLEPKVALRKDPALGRYDRACEVIYDDITKEYTATYGD